MGKAALHFLKINDLKQVVTVLRFSLTFSSLLYILINIQHSQVYRHPRWYSRGKTATDTSSIYGIEYKIIPKVLRLLSDSEYRIKHTAITNSPSIAKLCSCSDITYCQIRALSTVRPFFILSLPWDRERQVMLSIKVVLTTQQYCNMSH